MRCATGACGRPGAGRTSKACRCVSTRPSATSCTTFGSTARRTGQRSRPRHSTLQKIANAGETPAGELGASSLQRGKTKGGQVTWLYVPSESSPSALVPVGSILESEPPCQRPPLWVTSSGTPSQQPASWPEWSGRPWIELLSGTRLKPSTASRGVERWISSWVAPRAPISASPERRRGSTATNQNSSSNSFGSAKSATPRSSSGKTLEAQGESSRASSRRSRELVTPAPRSPFELLTLERRIDGSVSSFSVEEWATPAAGLANYSEPLETWKARSAKLLERGSRPLGINLGQQARGWATPQARDHKGEPQPGHNDWNLPKQVRAWPTPIARPQLVSAPPRYLKPEVYLPNRAMERTPRSRQVWRPAHQPLYEGGIQSGL
jgi:hypothetical protein